jgi:hypothetical protein
MKSDIMEFQDEILYKDYSISNDPRTKLSSIARILLCSLVD